MTVPEEVTAPVLAGQVLAPPGSGLVLAEWTAQAATGDTPLYQAPLHSHGEDEAWYVLSGALCVRVGDAHTQIGPGGAVIVPGGTAHTYWNPRPEPARYVLVMGARTYALIQAIHAAKDRSPQIMQRLFQEHGATLLDP
jgi:mannose-6-phosphate isomerase-like protein (cupin superfamily)